MFAVSSGCPIYHIALDRLTLCKSGIILNVPGKRLRFEDWRLASETPADRVGVLCSRCAELSGDERSFTERIIYPARSSHPC
jgi:hypothetical protein